MNPPRTRTKRLQRFWDLHDFSRGRGIEMGPLHNPILHRDEADVSYLDVYLKPRLLEHYAGDPHITPDSVPEIDFALILDDEVRTIPEAVGDAAPFDWVVASHVVEHVPDLVGWLDEVAQVTSDGGRLVLAVPDRRYCFDLHRHGTTVGQLIESHERGDKVPSVRAVYDYRRGHASVRAPWAWSGDPVGYENRIYPLDSVLVEVERARRGEYVDAHVWLFTPGSFTEQLVELRELGLSEWFVEKVVPTRRDELEFMTVLRRLPRDRSAWTDLDDEVPVDTMPDWLAQQTKVWSGLRDVRAKVRAQRERNRALRRRIARAEEQLADQRRHTASLDRRLALGDGRRLAGAATRRARRTAGTIRRRLRGAR